MILLSCGTFRENTEKIKRLTKRLHNDKIMKPEKKQKRNNSKHYCYKGGVIMLKRFVCILMTAVMAAGIPASANAEELGVVTADYLNVRDGASTADAIIGGLLNGTEVTINEVTDNGWCESTYGNGSAFVSGDYVTTGGEAVLEDPHADAPGTSEESVETAVEEAASGDASAEKGKEAAEEDRKSTRLNSSHNVASRMPSSA